MVGPVAGGGYRRRHATPSPSGDRQGRDRAWAIIHDALAGEEDIQPRTELERRILADPEWREGASWGRPRPGHPEGSVLAHIAEVLDNVERLATGGEELERLRLVALLHDTFKHRVDRRAPAVGENHHGMRARRFAERYVEDALTLNLIELHDEAHNAWSMGVRDERRWPQAEARAQRLIDRLGDGVESFVRFYQADNETGGKRQDGLAWFRERAARAR